MDWYIQSAGRYELPYKTMQKLNSFYAERIKKN